MKKTICFITLLFLILTIRIYYLSVIKNNFYKKELDNKTNITVSGLSAPRGRILDSNGNVLVDNIGKKTIVYNKDKLSSKKEVEIAYLIAQIISDIDEANELELKKFWLINNDDGKTLITQKEYQLYSERKINYIDLNTYKIERINDDILSKYSSLDKKAAHVYALMNKGYSYEKKIISSTLSDEEYAILIEKNVPGITGELSWERKYNYGNVLKDIFGTIGKINLENKEYYLNNDYKITDIVGLSNLEFQYDKYLQGKKAIYKLNNDGTLKLIEDSCQGNDLYLNVDIQMQQDINEILENNIIKGKKMLNTEYYNGSYVVVVDSKTGNIKAMTGRKISSSKEEMFIEETSNILSLSFTAGSVIKGASMTVGYQNNLIEVGKKIKDSCVKLYLNPEKCSYKSLGYIDDITALKTSSNYYQFLLAIKLTGNEYKYNMELNIDEKPFLTYRNTFNEYGLGSKTMIDLPNENTGLKGNKIAGDLLLNFAIGQYDTYTILELAQYMNTIANNGNRYKLNLLNHINDNKNNVIFENQIEVLNKVNLSDEYYSRIKEGMRQVLYLGTGYGYTNTKYKPAGKTGTSESFLDTDNNGINDVKTITSTYAMFAPYDDAKYTVVVVSPNVSHYDGKSDSMAYINRYISNDVTKLLFEKY